MVVAPIRAASSPRAESRMSRVLRNGGRVIDHQGLEGFYEALVAAETAAKDDGLRVKDVHH